MTQQINSLQEPEGSQWLTEEVARQRVPDNVLIKTKKFVNFSERSKGFLKTANH